jgi:predicted kinase
MDKPNWFFVKILSLGAMNVTPVPDVEEAVREFFRICIRRRRSVFTTTAAVFLLSVVACGFTTARSMGGVLEVVHASHVTAAPVTATAPANAPSAPSAPRAPLYLAMGAVGGIFFGCCTALVFETVDNRMKWDAEEEAEQYQIPPYSRPVRVSPQPSAARAKVVDVRPWTPVATKRHNNSSVTIEQSTWEIGPGSAPEPSRPAIAGITLMRRRSDNNKPGMMAKLVSKPSLIIDRAPTCRAQGRAQNPPEMPALPALPVPEEQPLRYVELAIGLSGSGKTSWFKRHGVKPLSSDTLRGIVFEGMPEAQHQSLVSTTLRSLLRARLAADVPRNHIDATNLSLRERGQWIKMAKSSGYEVHAVYFDVPVEVCVRRNRRRGRKVNEEQMRKMAERLQPPSLEEGFSKITTVRVKGAQPTKPGQLV